MKNCPDCGGSGQETRHSEECGRCETCAGFGIVSEGTGDGVSRAPIMAICLIISFSILFLTFSKCF